MRMIEGTNSAITDLKIHQKIYWCRFTIIYLLCDENTIEDYGETSLTDGQMKGIITISQFVLARILNNEEHWHCFYQTRRGGVRG